MSPNSLRTLAVTVAGIVAIMTAVVVGLLTTGQDCRQVPASVTVTLPPAPTTPGQGGVIGDSTIQQTGTPAAATPAPATTTVQTQTAQCTDNGFGTVPAAAAFLGALAAGLVAFLLLTSAIRAARRQPAAAAPVSAPPAGTPNANRQSEADRAALISTTIYVRDRVTSRALADRLGATLRDAGVATLEPAGAPFDPAHHEAAGSVPTDDPAKVGSIAAVEVPGYADRGRLLRAPVVTVYQASDRTRRENR